MPGPLKSISRENRDGKQAQADGGTVRPESEDLG
jgi:hypothetical protein